MKYILSLGLIIFISVLINGQNHGHKNKSKENCKSGKGNCIQQTDSIKYNLSSIEKDGLIYMRLEEKLARDIYLTLGKTYKQKMFINIPKSEQRHMEAVKVLLDKYEMTDPIADDAIGSFGNTDFKKLYDDLVAKEIEEMDIKDLDERVLQTDNPDIKDVYENLKRGSENHLRAFTKHL